MIWGKINPCFTAGSSGSKPLNVRTGKGMGGVAETKMWFSNCSSCVAVVLGLLQVVLRKGDCLKK